MNSRKVRLVFIAVLFTFLESCGIFGIHTSIHNPKHGGKLPAFSKETILLGELTKYRECFDVYYYDLSIEFEPDHKNIDGVVKINAIAMSDFDTIQLDLHANLQITSLLEEKEIPYKRVERAIFIPLTKKKGEQFCITIHYNGNPVIAKKPPWLGGTVWKKDKQGNHWDGVACESDGASIWWPLKDHTSDEPDSMRLHYTVPKELTAVGNGHFEGKTTTEKLSTYNWFISYPINTYNVTFYIGKFKLLEDEYKGINGKKLKLNHYVLEPNYEKAKKHFQQLHNQLRVYEEKFGEYPWYRDGFKLVESPYAGMEHQSAIAYGNGYKNDLDSTIDYIILHETAHEWWGNSVTAKDINDVWLHEGFATYSEALYLETTKGKEDYTAHLNIYRLFIQNKFPVVGVKDRRFFHYKMSGDVYMKGAWILHTLRMQIDDDEIFFDIIKTFATRYRQKIVESKDFIALVNEKTDMDYNWFFNQYLNNRKVPVIECARLPNTGKLFFRWKHANKDFNQLKVRLESNGETFYVTPSNEIQRFDMQPDVYGYVNFTFYMDNLIGYDYNKDLLKELPKD